jgi:hypothetical protein
MAVAALAQLGISLASFRNCRSRSCLARIEKASREVLRVGWKPISLFPHEAKRFQWKRHAVKEPRLGAHPLHMRLLAE